MKAAASILVVDDQAELVENIGLTLEVSGFRVLTAYNGFEALEIIKSQPVDLILADIVMPRMNGYQLYERVRENPQWVTIPFIFLTARSLDSDIRYGKELGADDYLTKPIQPEDLMAAVHGKLRRRAQLAAATPPSERPSSLRKRALEIGRLQIDPGQHRVWMDGKPIQLSAREFTLLEFLARHAGKVLSPKELVGATHGVDTDNVEAGALLRPLIRSLRRKMGYLVDEMGCIENIRGVGYRLIPPEN